VGGYRCISKYKRKFSALELAEAERVYFTAIITPSTFYENKCFREWHSSKLNTPSKTIDVEELLGFY
jgi:hypothetical protein